LCCRNAVWNKQLQNAYIIGIVKSKVTRSEERLSLSQAGGLTESHAAVRAVEPVGGKPLPYTAIAGTLLLKANRAGQDRQACTGDDHPHMLRFQGRLL